MTILKLYNGNNHVRSNADHLYRFSDLMKDFYGNDAGPVQTYTTPRVNITEEKDSYFLFLAVPGLKKSDIKMNVEDEVLTISHQPEKEDEAVFYNNREFNYRNFERTFRIPETVNTDKIKATYEDGILSVKLPKRDDAVDRGPKEIKIS